MHSQVANYFSQRREDDVEEVPEKISDSKNNTQQSSPQKLSSRKRNVTNWSVGITTAPRQQPTLERTLNSLAEAGWKKPHLFAEPETVIPDSFQHLPVTRHPQTLGAFPNWYLALSEMVLQQPQAEAFFICQDDVLFSAGLRDYLEQHLWSAAETGVVSVYCPSHYSNGKQDGFYIEDRGWDSWGALTYIFPNRSARHLLSDPMVLNHRDSGPANGLRNVDSVVGAWCQRAKLQYIVHSPSLAQHIGDTSTIWTNGSNRGYRRASRFSETLT